MGRLNEVKSWCQKTTAITYDYIQFDMGALQTVCAIATQGKKNGSLVKSYKLSFSTDESSWVVYQEQNIDKAWNNSTLIFSSLIDSFAFLNRCANHLCKMNLWQSHVRFWFINCAKKISLLLKMIMKYLVPYKVRSLLSCHLGQIPLYAGWGVCAVNTKSARVTFFLGKKELSFPGATKYIFFISFGSLAGS